MPLHFPGQRALFKSSTYFFKQMAYSNIEWFGYRLHGEAQPVSPPVQSQNLMSAVFKGPAALCFLTEGKVLHAHDSSS